MSFFVFFLRNAVLVLQINLSTRLRTEESDCWSYAARHLEPNKGCAGLWTEYHRLLPGGSWTAIAHHEAVAVEELLERENIAVSLSIFEIVAEGMLSGIP